MLTPLMGLLSDGIAAYLGQQIKALPAASQDQLSSPNSSFSPSFPGVSAQPVASFPSHLAALSHPKLQPSIAAALPRPRPRCLSLPVPSDGDKLAFETCIGIFYADFFLRLHC